MRITDRGSIRIAAGFAMTLLAPIAATAAQDPGAQGGPGGGMPPMGQMMPGGPGMGQMMGIRPMSPAQMAVTSEYLYVLRGNTLYQLSTRDITQMKKLTLPNERMGPPGPGGMPPMPGMPGGEMGPPPGAPDGRGPAAPQPEGANVSPQPGAPDRQAPNAGEDSQEPGFGPPQPGPGMQGPGGPMGMGPGMPGMPNQMGQPPFRMGMGMGMGPGPQASLAATNDYVFVLRGSTIFQISAKDLKIVKKVTLPDEMMAMPGMGPQGMPSFGGPMGPGGPPERRGGPGRPPQ